MTVAKKILNCKWTYRPNTFVLKIYEYILFSVC